MFDSLLSQILPVAFIGFIGWVFGKSGRFTREDAQSINKYVFYIALPVLMFRLLAQTPWDQFSATLNGAYLLSEAVVYGVGFALARYVFRRGLVESVLLGMAAGFVNHVFFVLPVALDAHGSVALAPIMSIVTVDSIAIYAVTVLALDALTAQGASPAAVALRTARNPHVAGILLGLTYNFTGLPMPDGLDRFTDFVSASAAPAALFSLGLILGLRDHSTGWAPAVCITGLKTLVHPLTFFALLPFVAPLQSRDFQLALLVAAGPCGALPFVLALHYRTSEDNIAQAILLSSVVSLVGLALLL